MIKHIFSTSPPAWLQTALITSQVSSSQSSPDGAATASRHHRKRSKQFSGEQEDSYKSASEITWRLGICSTSGVRSRGARKLKVSYGWSLGRHASNIVKRLREELARLSTASTTDADRTHSEQEDQKRSSAKTEPGSQGVKRPLADDEKDHGERVTVLEAEQRHAQNEYEKW
ncbi:hypothetical protein K490DRAFT_59869 [Saccharata proteae CBS 121410]|uniref:Uncharacterized protein n=1 Tax=Saccharata proteae CBS 121410 TaxID=1314787 RepID=A0A9P4HNQ8_9PEZI|nr:hypothetical protein K490DRAFT_59869 [Saccharata proteae CBS 121410]